MSDPNLPIRPVRMGQRPIDLVHQELSSGAIVVYNPDWEGDVPTEWIRSSEHTAAEAAR